jgi:hypothetical protein
MFLTTTIDSQAVSSPDLFTVVSNERKMRFMERVVNQTNPESDDNQQKDLYYYPFHPHSFYIMIAVVFPGMFLSLFYRQETVSTDAN